MHDEIHSRGKSPTIVRASSQVRASKVLSVAKELQSARNEEVAKYVAEFPKEFPTFAEIEDPEILSRIHPNIGEEVGQEKKDLPREEQYCWDFVAVYKVGDADKMIKVKTETEAEDEDSDSTTRVTSKSEGDHFHEITAASIGAMQAAGLKVATYMSVQKDEIYCLVGIDEARAAKEASRVKLDVPLDPNGVKRIGHDYNLDLAKNAEYVGEDVFKGLYGCFVDFPEDDSRRELYQRMDDGPYHPQTNFRSVDRLKLIYSIIGADIVQGGAVLKPRKEQTEATHPLLAFFPLHHKPQKQKLQEIMLASWKTVFHPPEAQIKDYFGEELGMYFCFLSHYTKWLVTPALVGLVFIGYMIGSRNPATNTQFNVDPPAGFLFGLFVCIWSTAFLEAWGRKQARLASDWGMTNLEDQQVTRPEFTGELRVDPITGVLDVYFPFWTYLKRLVLSRAVVISLLTMVISLIVSMFILRIFVAGSSEIDSTTAAIVLASLNFVQIQTMNFIYGTVSGKLNDWENHRTDEAFENARILKSFIFKFFNTYSTFIYIILFKRTTNPNKCVGSYNQLVSKVKDETEKAYLNGTITAEQWPSIENQTWGTTNHKWSPEALKAIELFGGSTYEGDCVQELAIQLGVVFALALIVNNTMEIGIPFIKNMLTARREAVAPEDGGKKGFKKMSDSGKSDAEEQYEYVQYEGTFGDYDELVVQFGYAVLFVTACPLVPLAALINNIVEYKLDAHKVLAFTRRPIPRSVSNMGYWQSVLAMLSWIAIFFIVAISTFSSRGFAREFYPEGTDEIGYNAVSWAAFILLEHSLFFIKLLVSYCIPDEPEEVATHQRRSTLIVDAIIHRKHV